MKLPASNILSGIILWCKGHEEFFAVHLSRILAVCLIIAGFFYLAKAFGLV